MALDGIGGALSRLMRPAAPMPATSTSTVQAGGGTPTMLGDMLNLSTGATAPAQPAPVATPTYDPQPTAAPVYTPTAPAQGSGSPLPLGSIYASSTPSTPAYPQGAAPAVNPTPWNNPNYPQAGTVQPTPSYAPTPAYPAQAPVYYPQPTPPQTPTYYPQPPQTPAYYPQPAPVQPPTYTPQAPGYAPSNLPWPFNGPGGQGVSPVVSTPVAPVGSSSVGSYQSSGLPIYQSSTIPVYTSH